MKPVKKNRAPKKKPLAEEPLKPEPDKPEQVLDESKYTTQMVLNALRSSQWELPEKVSAALPAHYYLQSMNKRVDVASGGVVTANYTLRQQQAAARIVGMFRRQNIEIARIMLPQEINVTNVATAITPEQQRAAVLRAIVAEREKRPVGSTGRRRRRSPGNGKPKANGRKS